VVYDPKGDSTFPAGMTISPNRSPMWTEDLKTLAFGIHAAKKKDPKTAPKEKDGKDKDGKDGKKDKAATGEAADDGFQPPRGPKGGAASGAGQEKPDLVIWHWKDPRLQSQQQTQAGLDKTLSHLCTYHVASKRFVQHGTDKLRVSLAPKERYAIGYDNNKYELSGSLDGRRYQDVYVINVETGVQRLALSKHRWSFVASPAGTHAFYYDDGHYYCYDFATGARVNLTKDAPVRFVNDEDDHNIVNPPAPALGWSKDSKTVLLSDNWDVWAISIDGGTRLNLTRDGKKDGLRYGRPFVVDPEAKGLDLAGTLYLSCMEEWTKKSGIVAIAGGKPGAKRLLWGDAAFDTLLKAKHADRFVYTRESSIEAPEYHATDRDFSNPRKLTNAAAQQAKYQWSAGSILVEYTSAKGKKLQGALFLPAHYEPG